MKWTKINQGQRKFITYFENFLSSTVLKKFGKCKMVQDNKIRSQPNSFCKHLYFIFQNINDMVSIERPDWQAVMTYVTSIYKHFEVDSKS